MATSAARLTAVCAARTAAGTRRWSDALHAMGAAMLAVAAAGHVQQYAAIVRSVRWIGPLFVASAAAAPLVAAALVGRRTRPAAALAGIAIRQPPHHSESSP
jgi:hypothetical protein